MYKMSRAVDVNDQEEGGGPAKRRKVDNNDLPFKTKVLNILEKLPDAVPGPYAVTGRLNAPMINIVIKNSKKVVHFPLYEQEAEIIQLIEQSPHGKVQDTVGDKSARNSWELSSGGFEILNPTWNDFVNNELMAKVKDEMLIEFLFTPVLNKLLLNKAGSFFRPHDSKRIDGTFAMLVIQLPSLYKGGQITIRNEGRTVKCDYGSADSSNAFRTFYTAFYSDYLNSEHSSSKVAEGSRVYLIYNLISRTSVIPRRDTKSAIPIDVVAVVNLLKTWNHSGKLVYALKHKYSESNLSFANLKATDRSIANFLVHFARETDLNVCLAILNIQTCVKLTAMDGTEIFSTPLTVDFDAEVIPEDSYRQTAEQTGRVTSFLSSAAIVFWPKRLLIEVPKKNGASSADLDKIFMKEIDTYRGKVQDNNVKTNLKNWAKEIISAGGNKSIDVIKAIVELKDVQLIQSLFSAGVTLNEVSVSLVVDVCENYGWKTFADQVPQMFKKLSREDGIELLDRIGTAQMKEDKKTVVHNSMKVIFNKLHLLATMDEKEFTEERKFLLSACRLAEKIGFGILHISNVMPIRMIVPVLLQLVPDDSKKPTFLVRATPKKLPAFWKDVAEHFVEKMEGELEHNWRRNDTTNCSCSDCVTLNAFLTSNQESFDFKMGKHRRVHLVCQVFQMANIQYLDFPDRNKGVLVIAKTPQNCPKDKENRAFINANLAKLRAILPK